jgi:ornithine carbamoyltransferase
MTIAITAPPGLLRIGDLTPGQLNALLDLADAMREGPTWWSAAPRGGAVTCLFDERSAAARRSFEVALRRLGLRPVVLRAEALLPAAGEPLDDAARTLSSDAEAIVVGIAEQEAVEGIARAASVPVVNALSDRHAPCQALADLLTIRRRFGYLSSLRLAYVGDASNVLHSLMEAGALAGMQIVVATPRGREPRHDVTLRALQLAGAHGGTVEVGHDARSAVMDADVVYLGGASGQVDLRLARPHASFLAAGVSEQAANGLPARQALLHAVITGTLS